MIKNRKFNLIFATWRIKFEAMHSDVGAKCPNVGVKSPNIGVKSRKVGVKNGKIGVKSRNFGAKSPEVGVKNSRFAAFCSIIRVFFCNSGV